MTVAENYWPSSEQVLTFQLTFHSRHLITGHLGDECFKLLFRQLVAEILLMANSQWLNAHETQNIPRQKLPNHKKLSKEMHTKKQNKTKQPIIIDLLSKLW